MKVKSKVRLPSVYWFDIFLKGDSLLLVGESPGPDSISVDVTGGLPWAIRDNHDEYKKSNTMQRF